MNDLHQRYMKTRDVEPSREVEVRLNLISIFSLPPTDIKHHLVLLVLVLSSSDMLWEHKLFQCHQKNEELGTVVTGEREEGVLTYIIEYFSLMSFWQYGKGSLHVSVSTKVSASCQVLWTETHPAAYVVVWILRLVDFCFQFSVFFVFFASE